MRKMNKAGGGATTNLHGLKFEQTTSLENALKLNGYRVIDDEVFKNDKKVGQLCGKNKIYSHILKPMGIDWKSILSKRLLPDEAILVGKTLYIIEKKFQQGAGSVDEKLQTCDFKKKQYTKLMAAVGVNVEYIYVLNNWFNKDEYRDVHEYIHEVGCKYYFNIIPLEEIGLNS
jgi:hypothetical protein